MGATKKKIDAIYELRKAAEKKVLAEKKLEERPTQQQRDELLDATLDLEKKTVEAIEVCHECGHEHAQGTPHMSTPRDNVIRMDGRRSEG
jgi:hypothetical protein